MKDIIKHHITSSIEDAMLHGKLKIDTIPQVWLEAPREENHGDISTNISFLIAKGAGISPRETAKIILEQLNAKVQKEPIISKVETAGGGFINFFLKPEAFYPVLFEIFEKGEKYGCSNTGKGKKILIEFVSANPTGPLHVGHARNAAVGDVLANVLTAAGFDVRREYYLNDAGKQVNALGESLKMRYLQLRGGQDEVDVEYKGEYLIELSRKLLEENGKKCEEWDTKLFRDYAIRKIREGIERDLESFGVTFDRWFSEEKLHSSDSIKNMVKILEEKGFAERREGALWFKSHQFGDEKDRVIIKSDGSTTYLAADIAYHNRKLADGFDQLINVWGADHHGYIPRLKASLDALGFSPDVLDIVLIQLVKLRRGGKPVSMSTREGEFVTLHQVIDEVGKDSMRFFLLMRRSDAQLDFDLELAKRQSMENPVYYVQYAHARICSLISFARENGLELPEAGDVECELLIEREELALLRVLSFFPDVVNGSARSLEPHRLTGYLQQLASSFHNFYDRLRVVGEEKKKALARLFLVSAAQITLQNGLHILGISCPQKM